MKPGNQASGMEKPVRALGLCSGGLDSILSALILQHQGIAVSWIAFETPFFSSYQAENASRQTGIPLMVEDITDDFLALLKNPRAGFGKHMNPCMDCHALMFSKAGIIMKRDGFDFLFSGEVMGQRPKSQTRNSLRYVQKNSGFKDVILRPLSAQLLEETPMESRGLVNREQLYAISGRSRKEQIRLAEQFGVSRYPAPAGGCLLTDAGFSNRLKDLLNNQKNFEKKELHLLKTGRHFRIDPFSKAVVGRSQADNHKIMNHYTPDRDILIRHARLPGPDVLFFGTPSPEAVKTAAMICAAYSKSDGKTRGQIIVRLPHETVHLDVPVKKPECYKALII